MAKRDAIRLKWPMAGLDKGGPYRDQPPFSTPDCVNVRPFDVLAGEGRGRGGSRPGLAKVYTTELGDPDPVVLLNQVSAYAHTGPLQKSFDGKDATKITQVGSSSVYYFNGANPSTSHPYTVRFTLYGDGDIYVQGTGTPFTGDWTKISLTNSAYEQDYYTNWWRKWRVEINESISASVTELFDKGDYLKKSGNTMIKGEVRVEGKTLTVRLSLGEDPTKYTTVATVTLTAATAGKVGWDGDFYFPKWNGTAYANTLSLSLDYFENVTGYDRRYTVGVSDGTVYQGYTGTTLAASASANSVSSAVPVQSVEYLQRLYIADYGGDTVLPKIYNPVADTLENWVAEKGTVPVNCPIITRYRDRIVMAGNPSHMWYMSRGGDPLDWDVGGDIEDATRPISGMSSDAGTLGEPIRALCPYSDDTMLIGCTNSLWAMRGDPAAGGVIDSISYSVGIVGRFAWCHGPGGTLFFLGKDGLYVMDPRGQGKPENISRDRLPSELQEVDTTTRNVFLAYDPVRNGVHVFVVPITAGSTASTHWWFDVTTKSFWPETYQPGHEPFAVYSDGGKVMIGGRDGHVRRWLDTAVNDDGTAFSSYVVIGPFALGSGDHTEGIIQQIDVDLDENSDEVDMSVLVGQTFQAAGKATPFGTYELTGGLNHTVRPRARGFAGCLKFANGDTSHWTIDRCQLVRVGAGRLRKR